MKFTLILLSALMLMIFSAQINAHSPSQSFSFWTIHNAESNNTIIEMIFSIRSREVTRLAEIDPDNRDLESLLANHLNHNISLTSDNLVCEKIGDFSKLKTRDGFIKMTVEFSCLKSLQTNDKTSFRLNQLTIKNSAFFSLVNSHSHYARIGLVGQMPEEFIFTDTTQVHKLDLKDQTFKSGAGFISYFNQGIKHILIGYDHLVFLVALLLAARRAKPILLMISGFTIGHCITLSLSALDLVTPNIPVVESLIGFTIALVATDNLLRLGLNRKVILSLTVAVPILLILISLRSPIHYQFTSLVAVMIFAYSYLRLATEKTWSQAIHNLMTVMFGLIHGFAFSDTLMQIGLPQDKLLAALLGFNLGVEIGQIIFVAMFVTSIFVYKKLTGNLTAWPKLGSAKTQDIELLLSLGILGLGSYWFMYRALIY